MARLKATESAYKKSQAKDLFLKGFAISAISEIIGIGDKSIAKWRDLEKWENEKELLTIRPSEIKNLILEYVRDIKERKTPSHKADDLAKIASAFDRLNDNRKKAVYSMETISDFSGWMISEAGKNTGKKREEALLLLQEMRIFFDKYISELLQNDD